MNLKTTPRSPLVLATLSLFFLIPFQISHAQLVGYWNFDGEQVVDLSGTGNDGTLVGALFDTNVPGVLGGGHSLSFNNPTDHVFIAANPSLNSSAFTLSFFLNDRGQPSGINRITSREGDSFETGIDKVFGSDSLAYYPGAAGWQTSSAVPTLNTWQHVAYVSDGSTMTLYVDGAAVSSGGFTGNPSGFMHIGNRHNDLEGINGLLDDVALFDVPLNAGVIEQLADGLINPLEVMVEPPPPPAVPTQVVTSNALDWSRSTVVVDGGLMGPWDASGAPAPPDGSTFTEPVVVTDGATIPHIANAAVIMSDEHGTVSAIQSDNNIHYFRTTFELEPYQSLRAEITASLDNGGQIFLNGELVATETSFLVENWQGVLPGFDINEDGSISNVVKFDSTAGSFTGFVPGENEIIIALRNPSDEVAPAGGVAFRMDVFSQPIPEPSTVVSAIITLFGLLGLRRRRRD